MRFGGVEMGGLELRVSRRLLGKRRLKLLNAPGEVVAPALQIAQLPVEFRGAGHEFLDPRPQRTALLEHESILVLQPGPLLFDLLQPLLLGGELSPQRRQLFAHRVQAPPVVLQFPLGALELLPSIRERRAGFRSRRLGGAERLLEILDPPREVLLPDGEPVAFERERGVLATQALVRRVQGLELPLRLEMGDFGALDLDQGLIDRGQRLIELGADGLDVAERKLDGVEVRAQTFVAPADRIERARHLERVRFPVSARFAGRERAQALDDRAGFGRRGFLPRLIVGGEGSRVVRGRRAVLEQLFPTKTHGGVP